MGFLTTSFFTALNVGWAMHLYVAGRDFSLNAGVAVFTGFIAFALALKEAKH
jgi:hypothetical protein